jgi:hypothetical protein
MAYFSNGTEGDYYWEKYCSHCLHDDGCPVMDIHTLYNYDAVGNDADMKLAHVLDALIPRDKDGYNNKCNMFVPLSTKNGG